MSRLMHGICAAILTVVMAPSSAQTCRYDQRPADPEAGERLLASLSREGCLGSVDDPEPRAREFHATIGTRDQPGGPLALQDALEQLHRHARTRSREPVLMPVWSGLAREIERIIERLPNPAAMPPADYQSAVVDIVSPRWKAASGQGTGEPINLDGVRFKAVQPLACRTAPSCSPTSTSSGPSTCWSRCRPMSSHLSCRPSCVTARPNSRVGRPIVATAATSTSGNSGPTAN
jgi:hypothetical protein